VVFDDPWAAPPIPVAFADVTVIDGTGSAPKIHQTVLIQDQVITAVGPSATIKVPPNALIVDGRGRYLMPGLWDMHFHAWDKTALIVTIWEGAHVVVATSAAESKDPLGMEQIHGETRQPTT